MTMRKFVRHSIFLIAISLTLSTHANNQTLPTLGDASSGVVSQQTEHALGRAWLRALRSQAPILADPILTDYIESLIYNIASNSELEDHRLEIVILGSPLLNAFAVPGGVIGVNAGLFNYAKTEDEFSSVLAHEIAHLSQRHFARNVEEARRNKLPHMAAMLASVVVAATAGGDVALAAITSTQAAIQRQQLAYSRQNEQEADRIGMRTLVRSNYDPNAMPSLFEHMHQVTRLRGDDVPEYLLTHPLTQNRISDSRNRAVQYPTLNYHIHDDYYLMQARVILEYSNSITETINFFDNALKDNNSGTPDANRYGLALAYTKAEQPKKALTALTPLLEKDPDKIAYVIARSNIDVIDNDFDGAIERLSDALTLTPGNHPLTIYYAETLLKSGQATKAIRLLEPHTKNRPNDPNLWYLIAETRGLAGDIIGVHLARAEYFIMMGSMERATEQLKYAEEKSGKNFQVLARIEQRRKDIATMKKELEF